MKKLITLLMILLLCGCFAGCGANREPNHFVLTLPQEECGTPTPEPLPQILSGVTAEQVEKIGYNDNSVAPEDYARVYTDPQEIGRVLGMIGALEPLETEPEETEEAPGNYCSYDVFLRNGEKVTIFRDGDVIRCGGVYYSGALRRIPMTEEAVLYLEPGGILPERLNEEEWIIRGKIEVFDEENTMVETHPVVKRMDPERFKWVELMPKQEIPRETVSVKDAVLEFDLRDYDEISPEDANLYPNVDYKIIYKIIMPSGEERELFYTVTVYLF